MATNRPTGNLVEIIEQHSKDIRKLKGKTFAAGGFRPGETLYFTSDDTFDKADYPGLRAVKVKCQGGGGGGGYAETLILVSDLAASETVTVGAGGSGGSGVAGSNGENSSFGSHCEGWDGLGGTTGGADHWSLARGGSGGTGVGDIVISGGYGASAQGLADQAAGDNIIAKGGLGGSSHLGGGGYAGVGRNGAEHGGDGQTYGGGGGGAACGQNNTARTGGDGAPGIVIVELLY